MDRQGCAGMIFSGAIRTDDFGKCYVTVGVQSSEKRLVHGLVKFVPALACLFCLALLGTCLVESAYLISEPCTHSIHYEFCPTL